MSNESTVGGGYKDVVVDPETGATLEDILVLGRKDPETLLRWVYQNLGYSTSVPLDPAWIAALERGAINCTDDAIDLELAYSLQLKRYPVAVDEFLFGMEYLNKNETDIYPEVVRELRQINNADGKRIINPFTEGVFTGGIGSAKTTTALYTNAYQLYLLSCFEAPHSTFGLDPSSEIMFAFLGMAGEAADTDYDRFYNIITASPYFNDVFPYDKRKKTELLFPHNVQVVGNINTIGKNVIGGIIDEVNFGAIVQNSKKSLEGGEYNQSMSTYTALARRRKSRFVDNSLIPGILCLVSSKRYPGEFTDVKLEEAKLDKSIYVYDKRVWDVKPQGSFGKERFKVFVGALGRKPEIVTKDTKLYKGEEHLVVLVPMEYLKDFQSDLIGSLRDIAGVGTFARYPYFQDINAVSSCFGKRKSILNMEETDLDIDQLKFFVDLFTDKEQPRWVHCDLGLTSDSLGLACGYVSKFGTTPNEVGTMPFIDMDFVLRIRPPQNGEIKFHKMRKLLALLRQHGLPIKWVSFDSYQSADSIQILRQMGFSTGVQSMDIGPKPYAITKNAMYSGRVKSPKSSRALNEFASLEKDQKTGKIDHPPNGSKDCSDAFAGVVYGLTMRRELWAMHGVAFNQIYSDTKEVKVKEGEQYE